MFLLTTLALGVAHADAPAVAPIPPATTPVGAVVPQVEVATPPASPFPPGTAARLTVEGAHTDLVTLLNHIADVAQISMAVDPNVSGEVSLRVQDAPWQDVLTVAIRQAGLRSERVGDILYIHTGALKAPADAATTLATTVVIEARDPRPADANPTRYFYAPSAYALGHGRGYVSQKEVLVTSAAVGITDYLDVQLGTFLPTLLSDNARVAIVGAKASFSPRPGIAVGAGAQAAVFADGNMNLPFAVVTFGNPDRHLSVSMGSLGLSEVETRAFLLNVSACTRFSDTKAFVTENYLVAYDGDVQFLLPSGGFRTIGERFVNDFGLAFPIIKDAEYTFPIPWWSITLNFGKEREAAK